MNTKADNSHYFTRNVITLTLIGAFIAAPSLVMAQDDNQDHGAIQRRIFNHFDYNNDGVLNDREKYHARKAYARWKAGQDGSADRPHRPRPDVRPDRVRPDVRPDRIRDFRVRPAQINRPAVRRVQATRNQ